MYPEHDTKECKYIKHKWFAVNTSTRKTSVSGRFLGKSNIFVRRNQVTWNSVGSEHDIRRTHFGRKSPCSIGHVHVTCSSTYSPTFGWPSSQESICVKTSWGPIFVWGKTTHYKSGHTNRMCPATATCCHSQPPMTSTFARRPPRRAIPWQSHDHFEAQGTE